MKKLLRKIFGIKTAREKRLEDLEQIRRIEEMRNQFKGGFRYE